jgi:esterase/lipase superfamily enzyme
MQRPWTQLLFLLGLSFLAGCVTLAPPGAPMQVLVPVLYATDRNVDEAGDPGSLYGGHRGPVSMGIATVALSTRKEGESPFADWSRWEPYTGVAENRNELLGVAPLDTASFDELVDIKTAATPGRSVLLYVHGFRRDFDAVATNMAILAYETDLDSVPMIFSWPSSGSVFGYAGDVTNLQWSGAHLREVVKRLLARDSIETVHLAAHSLGSQGLLEAIVDLSRDDNARLDKLGEVVLASPDVDSELFRRDYLPTLSSLGLHVTVYATDNDVPLQTSLRVNRYKRLGDARAEIFIADGVETIVFSDVVTFMNSHDAFLEIGDLQADLHYLLNDGMTAAERPTLEAVATDRGTYWRAQPYPR